MRLSALKRIIRKGIVIMKHHFMQFAMGAVFGILAGFIMGILFEAFLVEQIKRNNIDIIDKFITPITTIASSMIAVIGVAIVISNQDTIAEKARINKLIATRSSLMAALVDLEDICRNYTLLACHGSNYTPHRKTLVLSGSNKKAISLVIENSRQKHQRSLGDLFTFFHIAVSKYEEFIYTMSRNHEMSEKLMDLVVHLISLRSLIQCYYLYGIDRDFDNFDPDIENAKAMFNKMLLTFEEYDGHTQIDHRQKK